MQLDLKIGYICCHGPLQVFNVKIAPYRQRNCHDGDKMAVFIREISIAGKIVVILKQAPSHGSPGGPTHLSVTGTNIQRSPILTRNRISKVGTFPLL